MVRPYALAAAGVAMLGGLLSLAGVSPTEAESPEVTVEPTAHVAVTTVPGTAGTADDVSVPTAAPEAWSSNWIASLSSGDCKGIASGDRSWCDTSDCKGIASGDRSWCDTSDCKGVASKDRSWCETSLCKGWASGDRSWCDTQDCKGVASKDRSWCESAQCKAIASGDRSWCP